jgi:tetratricopeptide (TPR) repeat protein
MKKTGDRGCGRKMFRQAMAGLLTAMLWLVPAAGGGLPAWSGGAAPVSAGPEPLVISADMQFSYADTRYREKDYPAAEIEFKRFLHFFKTDPRQTEAAFKTGMALFSRGRFHDAARQFNDLIETSGRGKKSFGIDLSDPFVTDAFFMQSRAFMNMGNVGYARVVLHNFLTLTSDPDDRNQIWLALARLHIQASRQEGVDELDQALASLEKISLDREGEKDTALAKEKQALIDRVKAAQNVPRKNPVLAGVLGVVPGGGFLYTGRFRDALAAFGLNAGLMLAAYTAFDQDNPALGAVIGFVEAGFYAGGIYGSIAAAHKYNHARKIRILDREFSLEAAWLPNGTAAATAPAVLFSFSRQF